MHQLEVITLRESCTTLDDLMKLGRITVPKDLSFLDDRLLLRIGKLCYFTIERFGAF